MVYVELIVPIQYRCRLDVVLYILHFDSTNFLFDQEVAAFVRPEGYLMLEYNETVLLKYT